MHAAQYETRESAAFEPSEYTEAETREYDEVMQLAGNMAQDLEDNPELQEHFDEVSDSLDEDAYDQADEIATAFEDRYGALPDGVDRDHIAVSSAMYGFEEETGALTREEADLGALNNRYLDPDSDAAPVNAEDNSDSTFLPF